MPSNPKEGKMCGAYARTTGKPCQKPPMANGRCRLHGGLSTGRPITSGYYTNAARAQRARLRELMRAVKETLKEAKESSKQFNALNRRTRSRGTKAL